MHEATQRLLGYFEYEHLPPGLQEMSAPFCALAHSLAHDPNLDGPEVTVSLRKLLESKDAAVRSALPL